MAKVEFKLNKKGLEELLSSPQMQAVLEQKAQEIVDRAGEGYSYKISQGTKAKINRKTAFINTDTPESAQDNLENNTILKSLKG